MSSAKPPLDVAGLPTYAFGQRSLMWWGTLGMILIESTVFALAIVTYFYLRERAEQWPVGGIPPPLLYGTLNTAILIASSIPNEWTKKAAEREDLRSVRMGLLLCIVFAAVFMVFRVFEFASLNTSWNASAYGSIVFALLLLHTIHLVTDFIDTVVLTVLMFTGPLSGRRFVDVSENAMYWYFVVISWLFIYATIYIAPRLSP
jgi:heme/copper-type cytochrome/quinol oxidase subunit 3